MSFTIKDCGDNKQATTDSENANPDIAPDRIGKGDNTAKKHTSDQVGDENKEFCGPRTAQILLACTALGTVGMFLTSIISGCTASRAVADAREHSRTELQAYTSVVDGKIEGLDGSGPIKVVLTIKNTGQTPSYYTRVEAHIDCEPIYKLGTGPKQMQPVSVQLCESATYTLAAGQEFTFHKILPCSVDELKRGLVEIHASGTVYYTDVFERQQHESFCLMQGGPYEWNAPTMGVCPNMRVDGQ